MRRCGHIGRQAYGLRNAVAVGVEHCMSLRVVAWGCLCVSCVWACACVQWVVHRCVWACCALCVPCGAVWAGAHTVLTLCTHSAYSLSVLTLCLCSHSLHSLSLYSLSPYSLCTHAVLTLCTHSVHSLWHSLHSVYSLPFCSFTQLTRITEKNFSHCVGSACPNHCYVQGKRYKRCSAMGITSENPEVNAPRPHATWPCRTIPHT